MNKTIEEIVIEWLKLYYSYACKSCWEEDSKDLLTYLALHGYMIVPKPNHQLELPL